MIVRDEEQTLGLILGDAASFCDEMVVVDTGSVDGTVELAKSFGARVCTFDWINDFSAARNFALAQCSGEWVIWLDADDRVPKAAQDAIRRMRDTLLDRSDIDGVIMPYQTMFAADNPYMCVVSVNRERIFRNSIGLQWVGAIHEVLPIAPNRCVSVDDAWIEHRPLADHPPRKVERNLGILQDAVARGDDSSRTLYYLGGEYMLLGLHDEATPIFYRSLATAASTDEKYDTLCAIAECFSVTDHPDQELSVLAQAIVVDSTRPTAFIQLGLHHYRRQQWSEAMPYFAAATVTERPTEFGGMLNEPAYTWLPWDYLAICASELGRFEDALEFTTHALPGNPERERILRNVEIYLEKLGERKSPAERDELRRSFQVV